MRSLPDGLEWRKRKDGTRYEYIYYNKMYRGKRIRCSSHTSDPKEAERRLRKQLDTVDRLVEYGITKSHTFEEAATRYVTEAVKKTIKDDIEQLRSLLPYIGHLPLEHVHYDNLKPWIQSRDVAPRTINKGLQVAKRVLKLSRLWRDVETNTPWLSVDNYIPLVKATSKRKPYRLSWDEQDRLLAELPSNLRDMVVFGLNTGLREENICRLRWAWYKGGRFHIPGTEMKNGADFVLVLNSTARNILDRNKGGEYVFAQVYRIHNTAWKRAWRAAGLPVEPGIMRGVHNLRHTFAARLRDVGVDERDVEDLMHHVPKTVTRHYSAPMLANLEKCVEKIVRKPVLRVAM